ncbi:MAG: mechanosensitive ion channel domain-containing protein [Verrucomicrobiota bacterium]
MMLFGIELPDWLPVPIALNIGLVCIAALLLAAATRWFFRLRILKTGDSERRTGLKFLSNAANAAIFVLASLTIIYSIPQLRSLAVGVFAGAGILAAIIGFASQKAFANIVSGIFIVVFKPFRVDDIIKIGNEIGTVEDITLRHTVIKALENKRLIYPNSIIDSEAIINWTIQDEKAQKFMYLSIDYDADLELAIKIIKEIASSHPDLLDERSDEEKKEGRELVETPILNFENSMINFRIPLWAKDLPTAMRMIWDVQKSIKLRFNEEGIWMGRPSQVNFNGPTQS